MIGQISFRLVWRRLLALQSNRICDVIALNIRLKLQQRKCLAVAWKQLSFCWSPHVHTTCKQHACIHVCGGGEDTGLTGRIQETLLTYDAPVVEEEEAAVLMFSWFKLGSSELS